jgi:hypothetical protein
MERIVKIVAIALLVGTVVIAIIGIVSGAKSFTSCAAAASGHMGDYLRCLGDFIDTNGNSITSLSTVLLTSVTGGLVLVALKQEKTTRLQLRAYIGVESIVAVNVAPLPSSPPPSTWMGGTATTWMPTAATATNPIAGPAMLIVIKNFGATPAKEIRHWAELHLQEYPLRAPLPALHTNSGGSTMTFGPGGGSSKTVSLPAPLSSSEVNDLRQTTKALWVVGRVEYVDAFGKPHFMNLCFHHNGVSGNIGISTSVTAYDKGNEAD